MFGPVQRDVQQQSRLLCGSVSPTIPFFCKSRWALETSSCSRALPSSLTLGARGFFGLQSSPGCPRLELAPTRALRLLAEVSPCLAVHGRCLGPQQERETELGGQMLRLVFCRDGPSGFSWKATGKPLPVPHPPGFKLLLGLINKANGYKLYFITYRWYFYV